MYSRTSVHTTLYYYVIISFHCTLRFLFWFCSCCYFIRVSFNILSSSSALWAIPLTFQLAYLILFCFLHFRLTASLPKFVVLLSFHRVFLTINIHTIRLYTFRVTLAPYNETQKHTPMQTAKLSETLLKIPFVPDRSTSTHILLRLTLH